MSIIGILTTIFCIISTPIYAKQNPNKKIMVFAMKLNILFQLILHVGIGVLLYKVNKFYIGL